MFLDSIVGAILATGIVIIGLGILATWICCVVHKRMNKPKGKEDDNITQANAIALATANGDKKCDDDGKGGGGKDEPKGKSKKAADTDDDDDDDDDDGKGGGGKDEPKGKSKKAGGRYSHLDDVKDDIERANADYLKAVTFGDTMAAMADAFKKAMHS